MKKILALLLIVLCSFSLVACKDDSEGSTDTQNASAEVINRIADMFETSTPTKTIVGTTQTAGDTILEGEYILITGEVDGKEAATYYYNYDRLISVDESGALDYVTGTVVTETIYKEYLEGKGVRIDGGAWDASLENFAPAGGPMSLNLSTDLISKSNYDEATKTLSCIIAKDKTAEVLKQANDLTVDVAIEIVNDGASITSVTITYVIPANGKNPEISVEIKAFYTYDLEIIRIDTNEG